MKCDIIKTNFYGSVFMMNFTDEQCNNIGVGIINVVNEILGTKAYKLYLKQNMPDNYYGSHDESNNIYVNKKYYDDFKSFNELIEHQVKFVFCRYSSSLNKTLISRKFKWFTLSGRKEEHIYLRIKLGLPFDEKEYASLDTEIDAHAFQALIEEKYLQKYNVPHFDIPCYMDKDKLIKDIMS